MLGRVELGDGGPAWEPEKAPALMQEGRGEREREAREGLCGTPGSSVNGLATVSIIIICPLAVSMAICMGPKLLQGRKKGLGGRRLKGQGKGHTATL